MRLAELVGTLSMATDAGAGMPDHHALRGAIVAVRLAELVKADDRTVRDAYYLPLLAMSGCSAESHTASEALALNISVKTAGHHVQHVLEKLGVTTRAAATMIAMKTGLAQA